jgi:hypothetical protein
MNSNTVKITLSYQVDEETGCSNVVITRVQDQPQQLVRLFYNRETGVNLDAMQNIQIAYHKNYYSTLILKPLFRRLLRFAQCSKRLYELVIGHGLIDDVCKCYAKEMVTNASFGVIYDENRPLLYINSLVTNGQRLHNEIASIVNYRPPPPQPKPPPTKPAKKRNATQKAVNTTPKKKVKRG